MLDDVMPLVLQMKANMHHIMLGPGTARFDDGITLSGNAGFSVLKNRDATAFVAGTRLEVTTLDGTRAARLDTTGSAWLEWANGTRTGDKAQCIPYDTCGGEDHRRPSAPVTITLSGSLMPGPR
jgi:hypothetical protein